MYSYTSQLEVGNPRFSRREDVIWYLGFVSTAIIVSLFAPLVSALPFVPLLSLCVSSSAFRLDNMHTHVHLIYLPG